MRAGCEAPGSWEGSVASGDFALDPEGSREPLKGFSRAVASSDGPYRKLSMAAGGRWIG